MLSPLRIGVLCLIAAVAAGCGDSGEGAGTQASPPGVTGAAAGNRGKAGVQPGCRGRTRLVHPGGARSPGEQDQFRLLYAASSDNPPCAIVFAPAADLVDVSLRVASPTAQRDDRRVWCARARIPFERLPTGADDFGVGVEKPRLEPADSRRCVAVPAEVIRR